MDSTLTNLESNHEVHLRGLMWKELSNDDREEEKSVLQTRKINHNLLLQTFWNELNCLKDAWWQCYAQIITK